MTKTIVSIVKCEQNVEEAVREAVKLAGGFPDLKDKKVVLKPNLIGPSRPGEGETTDCRVVEAAAKIIKEAGGNPKVAEGAAVGFVGPTDVFNTIEHYHIMGYYTMAEKMGIKLVDLNSDDFDEIPVPNYYGMPMCPIPRTILDADLVFSMPVFKAHPYTGLTCACKNFQGIMPWRLKRRTHRVGLEAGLSDIYASVRPAFAIVDGLVSRFIHGLPESKTQKVIPIIVAGRDCTAVDATLARIVGYDPKKMTLLKFNAERKLGVIEENEIDVIGSSIEEVKQPMPWSCEMLINRYPVEFIRNKNPIESALTYGVGTALAYVSIVYGGDALKGIRIAIGEPPENLTEKPNVDIAIGPDASKWAKAKISFSEKIPLPSQIVIHICRILKLDLQPIIIMRKKVINSDWSDILQFSKMK